MTLAHSTRPVALQPLQQEGPESQRHWSRLERGGSCRPAAEKQTNEFLGTAEALSAPAHAALTLWMANQHHRETESSPLGKDQVPLEEETGRVRGIPLCRDSGSSWAGPRPGLGSPLASSQLPWTALRILYWKGKKRVHPHPSSLTCVRLLITAPKLLFFSLGKVVRHLLFPSLFSGEGRASPMQWCNLCRLQCLRDSPFWAEGRRASVLAFLFRGDTDKNLLIQFVQRQSLKEQPE